jgi:hypothetical protein
MQSKAGGLNRPRVESERNEANSNNQIKSNQPNSFHKCLMLDPSQCLRQTVCQHITRRNVLDDELLRSDYLVKTIKAKAEMPTLTLKVPRSKNVNAGGIVIEKNRWRSHGGSW